MGVATLCLPDHVTLTRAGPSPAPHAGTRMAPRRSPRLPGYVRRYAPGVRKPSARRLAAAYLRRLPFCLRWRRAALALARRLRSATAESRAERASASCGSLTGATPRASRMIRKAIAPSSSTAAPSPSTSTLLELEVVAVVDPAGVVCCVFVCVDSPFCALLVSSLNALLFAEPADELPDGVLGELLGETPFVVLAVASAAGTTDVRSTRTAQRRRKTRRRLGTRRAYRLPWARHALVQTVE